MAELQDQLNSILSNPQMMQQIMSIAGSLGNQAPQSAPPSSPPPSQGPDNTMPFDPAAMQSMMELLRSTQLDSRQQNLLKALGAYLPNEKLTRLQRAMQASRVARYASSALKQQSGR